MSHYCIGNPCWICHPALAPTKEPWPQILQERHIPEEGISGITRSLLLAVFDQGLDEDTHFREMVDGPTIEELQEERKHVNDNSMEATLLDRLIEDCLQDRARHNE